MPQRIARIRIARLAACAALAGSAAACDVGAVTAPISTDMALTSFGFGVGGGGQAGCIKRNAVPAPGAPSHDLGTDDGSACKQPEYGVTRIPIRPYRP